MYDKSELAMSLLGLCRITTPQFRSLRGMIKSGNKDAIEGACRFIYKSLYESHPSEKDRFHFYYVDEEHKIFGGWSLVSRLL